MDDEAIEQYAQIHADNEMAFSKIHEARSNGVKTIQLTPQSPYPCETIDYCMEQMQPGERILITLPRSFTHRRICGVALLNKDVICKVSTNYGTCEFDRNDFVPAVPDNILFALRKKGDEFVADIYHV